MDNAILHAGIDELNTIKEQVMELTGYQEKNEELLKEEGRLDKLIFSKEKDMNDEIESTLKKRRNELSESYEAQMATLSSREKKVKAKKEKDKGAKMTERIAEETAELREENKAHALEIKAIQKAEKIPAFCRTTLFFAFFMPKTGTEILLLVLCLLLFFLVIPFGLYLWLFAEKTGEIALALLYLVMILLVGGVYLTINNRIKEKHLEAIRKICDIRNLYYKNKRSINKIRRGIRKDEDESLYGLEQYDDELKEINTEIQRISGEEKEALNAFEAETTPQIKAEIKNRYEEEISSLKQTQKNVAAEQKAAEEKVKELSLMMSKQYEIYLGKDMLSVAKLDKLISHIEKGDAADIGGALAIENNK